MHRSGFGARGIPPDPHRPPREDPCSWPVGRGALWGLMAWQPFSDDNSGLKSSDGCHPLYAGTCQVWARGHLRNLRLAVGTTGSWREAPGLPHCLGLPQSPARSGCPQGWGPGWGPHRALLAAPPRGTQARAAAPSTTQPRGMVWAGAASVTSFACYQRSLSGLSRQPHPLPDFGVPVGVPLPVTLHL